MPGTGGPPGKADGITASFAAKPLNCAPAFFKDPAMTAWSPDQARKTYSIPHWAAGYFDVDGGGRVVVRPLGAGGPSIVLAEAVDKAMTQGANLPLLVRFPDVLGDRLRTL